MVLTLAIVRRLQKKQKRLVGRFSCYSADAWVWPTWNVWCFWWISVFLKSLIKHWISMSNQKWILLWLGHKHWLKWLFVQIFKWIPNQCFTPFVWVTQQTSKHFAFIGVLRHHIMHHHLLLQCKHCYTQTYTFNICISTILFKGLGPVILFVKKFILLFSKTAYNFLKVAVKTYKIIIF